MFTGLRLVTLAGPMAATGGYVAHWAAGLPPARSADFPTLLAELAGWTVVGCCAWSLALLLAAAAETGTRHRLAATRLVPAPETARRWALALLGAAVVTAGPLPAYAEHGGATPPRAGVAGLPLPSRPDGAVPGHPPVGRTGAHRPTPARVVVRAGDSLWQLVAAHLPASADEHTVAAAVAATYRANRAAIGPDPDLIRPGQRLVVRPEPHPHQEDR